jgi:hypothetical protein
MRVATRNRMAILLMVSDTATLLREVDGFALHMLTHWFTPSASRTTC